jgi:GPH family glycoside/pentoside/hexuronide:cation symporter
LTALATAGLYWVPTDNLPLVWAVQVLISLFAAPTAPLIWAMYADAADYSEWKSQRRATGLVFSAASFTQKIGWALGGAGVGWVLAYFQYEPGVVPSAETRHGIVLMMSLLPAVPALLACAAMAFYTLDEPRMRSIGDDLRRRHAG